MIIGHESCYFVAEKRIWLHINSIIGDTTSLPIDTMPLKHDFFNIWPQNTMCRHNPQNQGHVIIVTMHGISRFVIPV